MNMSFKSLFKGFIAEKAPLKMPDILDNGTYADKRDIEDPTAKFAGPVHIGEVFKTRTQRSNVSYSKSEYDLPMLANAVQLDGILRRAVNVFVEHVLKNGYEFNSKNDRIQKHISRRVKEIQNLTGLNFNELLNQVITQLVTYGNAYVVKVHSKEISKFGKPYRLFSRENNPIVGLFVLDASTMEVGLNPQGYVTTYKQTIRGEAREWDERDIIHFTYNKIPGTLTGQSQLLPVLDDVRALRKLEEEIEILGFQYSIPLYLYKVGNKDIPAAPGEVASVSQEVSSMPAYGMLVVPGHHTIEVPTNANNVLDIIKYINHFKQRIYSGIGVSPVAMGEGDSSNRATSEALDASMQSVTKAYQQILKNKIEMEFIRELLLDGGFKSIDDELEFNFSEIDLDNQIKKETHIVQLFQNNLITRTEARNAMDYEVNIDEKDTFLHLIELAKIKLEQKGQMQLAELNAETALETSKMSADNSVKLAKMKPTPSSGGTGASSPPAQLPKPSPGGHSVTKVTHKIVAPKKEKTTSNKVAPANQHGKAVRPKYVKNNLEENLFDTLTIFNKDEFCQNLGIDLKTQLLSELDYTINTVCSFYHIDKPILQYDLVDTYFKELDIILNDKISRASKVLDDDVKLYLCSDQTKEFFDTQFSKIQNLAKILLCKSLGFKTILITSDECSEHADINLEIAQMDYNKIPPFGYNCKCEVNEENFYEFQ